MVTKLKQSAIVVIVGPTASGKSDLAMAVSRKLTGEIVSCDSVQVYRGLDIGSGKPSLRDRREIKHHLVDVLLLDEEMNAFVFAQAAAKAIAAISSRGSLPVVAGGTGLYLTALLKGLFDQGEPDPKLRRRLDALMETHGPARLHRLLSAKDPEYAAKTEVADRVRIVRALEVYFALGRPFSIAQRERRPAFTGCALLIGLNPGRDELRRRVTERVGAMLNGGLIDETRRTLAGSPSAPKPPRPLGAIGYREVVARLAAGPLNPRGDGELQRAIVAATMQYAKRQLTYFKHQFEIEWFTDQGSALGRIERWTAEEGSR